MRDNAIADALILNEKPTMKHVFFLPLKVRILLGAICREDKWFLKVSIYNFHSVNSATHIPLVFCVKLVLGLLDSHSSPIISLRWPFGLVVMMSTKAFVVDTFLGF